MTQASNERRGDPAESTTLPQFVRDAAAAFGDDTAVTFSGETLDDELESRMLAFVNDPARNGIDSGAGRLELSQIFEWYADDFGGPDELAAYVDRYTERRVADYAVSFRSYSWELNDVSP